jgi:2',3'-cyclic-nucleotide 2'-phosphodiesterase (5'-nucleotidase family)
MHDEYGITLEPTTCTWISTNIDGADGKPIAGCKKHVQVDWHGVSVGIISVSENWLPGCSKLKSSEAVWLNDVEEATKACKELRANGAEVILAVTHSGITADKVFMAAIPPELLDLCCGGHDHDYIRDEALRIVKAGQEWRYLSDIEFELPPKGTKGPAKLVKCEQVSIKESIVPDPHIGDLISKWEGYVAQKAKKVLGTSPFDLDSTEAALRWKEGVLSNWIADVIASDFSADEGAQMADFAMFMGFTIAGKVLTPKGDITYGELLGWFPSNETVVVLKLTGAEVLKSLERGCGSLPAECGSLHHVSRSVKYEVDISIPKGKGRVKNLTVHGEPIDPAKVYTVAVSSAMAQGKYGYDWMGKAPRVVEEEFSTPFLDLIRDWLKAHKSVPTDTDHEGTRIKIFSSA